MRHILSHLISSNTTLPSPNYLPMLTSSVPRRESHVSFDFCFCVRHDRTERLRNEMLSQSALRETSLCHTGKGLNSAVVISHTPVETHPHKSKMNGSIYQKTSLNSQPSYNIPSTSPLPPTVPPNYVVHIPNTKRGYTSRSGTRATRMRNQHVAQTRGCARALSLSCM
ncbi:unnamed protein product [Periconia digitata]|uniref:Uncharacterized protein n=1 Tax=Periconia digitata TaxID=1303443 RepID=A0A9W4U5P4_9PLEO|nr:unnamed protein product [Periconia digitata]